MLLRAFRGEEGHVQHKPSTAQPVCPPALASPGDTIPLQVVPCSEGVQANRQVLIKQNGQVGSFGLDLSLVNPAAHWGIPAQIRWVDVQDTFWPRVRDNI